MRSPWLLAVLVLLAAIVPVMGFSGYHLFQMTMVVVYAIAILGLALLIGLNGQISLGHGAFYAIGAYTSAILMTSGASTTRMPRDRQSGWAFRERSTSTVRPTSTIPASR